uniref:3'-phosphate/5'-hydroxy nucleic acid ligase n=1 Tax=Chromera velia CCMP2878 TaxID=1169474 RepID=A0A0G4F1L8_9ALVE|eukprot:Cvel_14592.t1-p1 / transcript=Cvel_14592.t1 / gene=Cvel_14592 / organism=Chromera_velia_CCMP2878 / gene_product=tRNA-splicing ligase RtcB, putative / transcript_product=tRNA-splicing ligase RtcB, putative / location=Cvel_scaffold1043:36077-40769(+) / protein_length=678 / sequence_SO=supercontig / SO=protein_coding / is_pseudo=false
MRSCVTVAEVGQEHKCKTVVLEGKGEKALEFVAFSKTLHSKLNVKKKGHLFLRVDKKEETVLPLTVENFREACQRFGFFDGKTILLSSHSEWKASGVVVSLESLRGDTAGEGGGGDGEGDGRGPGGEVRVIAVKSEVEPEALKQLERTAQLPGCRYAVGMPDLHPGKGFPIGASVLCSGVVYPFLVGGDIGCGMSMVDTGRSVSRQFRSEKGLERFGRRLQESFEDWQGFPLEALEEELQKQKGGEEEEDGYWGEVGGGVCTSGGAESGERRGEMSAYDGAQINLEKRLEWPSVVPPVLELSFSSPLCCPEGEGEKEQPEQESMKQQTEEEKRQEASGVHGEKQNHLAETETAQPKPIHLRQFDSSLGSVGGGNHFAELQAVEEVRDAACFSSLGLSEDRLLLLVHSGSRGLGAAVLDAHMTKNGTRGATEGGEDFVNYMKAHDAACAWAVRNRQLIARRFFACAGLDFRKARCVFDIVHNNVCRISDNPSGSHGEAAGESHHEDAEKCPQKSETETATDDPVPFSSSSASSSTSRSGKKEEQEEKKSLFLHRKGAAPAVMGNPIVIPGSRGAFSFLVMPSDDSEALQRCGMSVAHGAGRKMDRGSALEKVKHRVKGDLESLYKTTLGSRVVCGNKSLLYEEAPEAYKEIEAIVEDLEDAGAVRVVAVLRPLVTFKCS